MIKKSFWGKFSLPCGSQSSLYFWLQCWSLSLLQCAVNVYKKYCNCACGDRSGSGSLYTLCVLKVHPGSNPQDDEEHGYTCGKAESKSSKWSLCALNISVQINFLLYYNWDKFFYIHRNW